MKRSVVVCAMALLIGGVGHDTPDSHCGWYNHRGRIFSHGESFDRTGGARSGSLVD